jgi:hypothetical protein
MENSVCKLTVIQNPNRRYANTVNIVFFKAIPLTKNFQKYVDGLKGWKEYIKRFPDSQLQLFIDKGVAEDTEIQPIIRELGARVILFECPDYMRDDGFHIGLFGTMLRFFPMFDINTRPFKVAHISELEPDRNHIENFKSFDEVSKMKDISLVYESTHLFETDFSGRQLMSDGLPFPWMSAGKFSAMERIPFDLWKKFVYDIKHGKKWLSPTGRVKPKTTNEHGEYYFGVDESFLNFVYLPWLIKKGVKIAIIIKCNPAFSTFYLANKIKKDPRSSKFFNCILGKNQSVTASLTEFDRLFYYKDVKELTPTLREYSGRYAEIVSKYPDWLGEKFSKRVLQLQSNCNTYRRAVVIKDRHIVEIIDL